MEDHGYIDDALSRHRPFNCWESCNPHDRWLLITRTGDPDDPSDGLTWAQTFSTEDRVQEHVRHDLRSNERLVALVDLSDGTELVPALVWLRPECSWPGCHEPPATTGRSFLGGRMCGHHTAESHERDAEARDEIEAYRDAAAAAPHVL